MRTVTYMQQWFILIFLLIALIAWVVALETIADVNAHFCELRDGVLWKGDGAPFMD